MYKAKLYSILFIIALALIGCSSGARSYTRLYPEFDKKLYQTTQLPITVAVYIEPMLRDFVQEERFIHYNVGVHRFVFPIGKYLSQQIQEMLSLTFKKAVLLENLQDKEFLNRESADRILAINLKNSQIELCIDESVWRAIGKHNLAITASYMDYSKQDTIWDSEIAVEGKGLDFISSRVEYEWWVISGPKFEPAVNDAIEKITHELYKKLIATSGAP